MPEEGFKGKHAYSPVVVKSVFFVFFRQKLKGNAGILKSEPYM